MNYFSASLLIAVMATSVAPLNAADYVVKPDNSQAVTVASATSVRDNSRPFALTAPAGSGAMLRKATPAPAVVRTPFRAGVMPVNLQGSVVYPASAAGMYSIPSEASGEFSLLAAGVDANGGGVEIDGVYYAAYQKLVWGMYKSYYVQAYNASTWELKGAARSVSAGMMATDVSLDPVSGKVYGCYFNDDGTGPVFGTADYSTGVRTVIKTLDKEWNACAFDAEGNLYAIDIDGVLHSVDKSTGTMTRIGVTGLKPYYVSSGTIDPRSGRFFYACKPDLDTAYLYEIDLTYGSATRLYPCPNGEEIVGMYVAAPLAEDKAPAPVTDLDADFPAGALAGTVSFSVPATTFDGESASGDLTYNIFANGKNIASGATRFGADENIPVSVDAAGEYEFIVTLSNEIGSSPRTRVTVFVGHDTPLPVSDVKLMRADGKFLLSWSPATATVNGGYIDVDAVTYKVIRYPDEIVVDNAVTGTSLTDDVPEPDGIATYYYTVSPVAAGLIGGETRSNTVTIGAVTPPYTVDFSDGDVLESFTIIDANSDGWQWMWDYDAAWLGGNYAAPSDDWLITPPLRLEGGKMYRVSLDAFGANTLERLEIKWGTEATVSGMSRTLLKPVYTDGNSMTPLRVNEFITPTENGVYYIGIHGISDPDSYGLYIDNFEISAPVADKAPAEVGRLSVKPSSPGSRSAVITFVAPVKALDGSDIESLESIEVLRDGVKVSAVDSPLPGQEYSVTDEVTESAYYNYTVVAVNEAGHGKESSARVFLGINVPAPVSGIKVAEQGTDGDVTISWSAPETDIDGQPIDPSNITYRLIELTEDGSVSVADRLTETSYSYRAPIYSGRQELKQWAVYAMTESGFSTGAESSLVAIGLPYATPYSESFAGANTSSILGVSVVNGDGFWGIYPDSAFDDVDSQDGDNGLAAMTGYRYLDEASMFTGKIKLGNVSPGLSFYIFKIDEDDTNTLAVHADAGNGPELLRNVEIASLPANGWNLVSIPLDSYAGKSIQLYFTGKVSAYDYIMIDNIKVGSMLDRNISVTDVTAPRNAVPGTPLTIGVEVTNIGLKKAEGYSVTLYRDGVAVSAIAGDPLAAGEIAVLPFDDVIPAVAGDEVGYHAVASWSDDEDTGDNTSSVFSVTVRHPSHPIVTDLTAEDTDGGICLSWSVPEIPETPAGIVTDSFEDYDAFTTTPGAWTLVDADKEPIGNVGAMSGGVLDIPGIPSGSAQSWWVWDLDEIPLNRFDGPLTAHSGSKFLTQIFNDTGVANDDWAISPELSGAAQTISFYATSMQRGLFEAFEVLYSTTGTDISSFTSVKTVSSVPYNGWTLYNVDLPEGARYFAIRCISEDRFMLHIDDVTFERAASAPSITLVGYHVYRDGERITDTPVTDTYVTDTDAGSGDHTYQVTAVYDRGESRGSNTATVSRSGIENVAGVGVIGISVSDNEIVVTGAVGLPVRVYTVSGRSVFAATGDTETRIALLPGIYVVKAANIVEKVIVK